jgi:ATP-dependent RNA helicase DDX10/DBP4
VDDEVAAVARSFSDDDGYVSPDFQLPSDESDEEDEEEPSRPTKRSKVDTNGTLEDDEVLALRLLRG